MRSHLSKARWTKEIPIRAIEPCIKVIHPKSDKHLKKLAQHSHLDKQEWAGFWQNSLYFK